MVRIGGDYKKRVDQAKIDLKKLKKESVELGDSDKVKDRKSVEVAPAAELETSGFAGIKGLSLGYLLSQAKNRLFSRTKLAFVPGKKSSGKDRGKRLRLVLIAILIPLLFGIARLEIINLVGSLSLVWLVILSSLFAFITYTATIYGFRGQVKRDSFFTSLALPSLYVFCTTLFLDTLFAENFERLYRTGGFVLLLFIFMVTLYIVLLSANIINVNLFKAIPLAEIGYTVMYLVGIISIYFISLGILIYQSFYCYSWWGLGLAVLILLVVYFVTFYIQLYRTIPNGGERLRTCFLFVLVSILGLAVLTFVNIPLYIMALAPVLIYYVLMGLFMHRLKGQLPLRVLVEYSLIIGLYFGFVIWQVV